MEKGKIQRQDAVVSKVLHKRKADTLREFSAAETLMNLQDPSVGTSKPNACKGSGEMSGKKEEPFIFKAGEASRKTENVPPAA